MPSATNMGLMKSHPSMQLSSSDVKNKDSLFSVIKFAQSSVDFGQTLPQTVNTGCFDFKLKKKLRKPLKINVQIVDCDLEKQKINPVFGLESQTKMTQKRQITLGSTLSKNQTLRIKIFARTNKNSSGKISAKVKLSLSELPSETIEAPLLIQSMIANIFCPKQLYFGDVRSIKCQVTRDQDNVLKILFSLGTALPLVLEAELIGGKDQKTSPLVLRKTTFDLKGKGQFMVEIASCFTQEIQENLFQQQKRGKIGTHQERKVLIFKIKGIDFFYHFPLVIKFYSKSRNSYCD